MDKGILVADGHALLRLLDKTIAAPRGAMWVNTLDSERWQLLVLPAKGIDEITFSRLVTDALFDHCSQFTEMHDMPSSLSVKMISDDDQITKALNSLYWLEGESMHNVGSRMLGSHFIANAILLRWATEEAETEAVFELG